MARSGCPQVMKFCMRIQINLGNGEYFRQKILQIEDIFVTFQKTNLQLLTLESPGIIILDFRKGMSENGSKKIEENVGKIEERTKQLVNVKCE